MPCLSVLTVAGRSESSSFEESPRSQIFSYLILFQLQIYSVRSSLSHDPQSLPSSPALEISAVSSYLQDACIVSGGRELNRGKCDQ